MSKTMGNNDSNGTRKNVPDVQFWGDGDAWKLICKASSEKEEWMKSTKAMEIDGVGCLVQVTFCSYALVLMAHRCCYTLARLIKR